MCEYCVMGTYARIYEKQRYRHITHPTENGKVPTQIILAVTNVFHDNTDASVPSLHFMVHDKLMLNRHHDTIRMGCCLTYQLDNTKCTGVGVSDHEQLLTFRWSSPTLLQDYYDRVWTRVKEHPSIYTEAKNICSEFVDRFSGSEEKLKAYLSSSEALKLV